MLSLDDIRSRLDLLRGLTAMGDLPLTSTLSLQEVVSDLSALMAEIEALRSMCPHAHTLPMYDENEAPTGEFACVNCHQILRTDGTQFADGEDYTSVKP